MESVITDFNEKGFSILQGVLEPETLAAAKSECEALVEALARQRKNDLVQTRHTEPQGKLKI